MKKTSLLLFSLISLYSCQNSNAPQDSIDVLMSEMTIEEKVGQTCQITLDAILVRDSAGSVVEPHVIDEVKLQEAIGKYKVGSMLNVSSHTLSLVQWHYIINEVQSASLELNKNVPIIYGVDAIHGANYIQGGTLFPQEIGLAATWNLNHAETLGHITAYETRASGVPWNFSPVLDLGRQPLWSRNFETLGEDVYLASEMGKAIVEGYQSDLDEYHVAACLKHYVGYSNPASGRDRTPAWIPERMMEEYYLPPFEKSINAGALTVMVNSGEVNGIPGHANKYLLTDILKDKWGFKGFAVSDWEDFINLHKVAQTDSTRKAAIATAMNAGVDMSMVPNSPDYKEYCELLVELVTEGAVSMERLDDAVRRILYVKKEMGLFDEAGVPANADYSKFGSEEHANLAYQAAAESVTLLKNEDSILPLAKTEKVLLIGPTANSLNCLNGAWTHTWQGVDEKYNSDEPTIKEVFEARYENVRYFEGSRMLMVDGDEADEPAKDLQAAVKAAASADVAVVCVGEMPSTERPGDIYSLELAEEQKRIVESLEKTGIPVVLVLVEGRPKVVSDIEPLCDAVIQAYLPGDQGAKAIVDVISGDVNPSGKLPYTYPRHAGAILHYDHKQSEVINANTWQNDFYNPQWDFGFGLSYTTYEYSNLRLSAKTISSNDELSVSVDVKNTGDRDGKEVVQLYTRDHYASISPSLKKLKRFEKIDLKAGESTTVEFSLTAEDLEFYGLNDKWVAEDGEFSVMVGGQIADFNLKN